jgi:hypothetical protein
LKRKQDVLGAMNHGQRSGRPAVLRTRIHFGSTLAGAGTVCPSAPGEAGARCAR